MRTVLMAIALGAVVATARGQGPCASDLDCSGDVGVTDLVAVITAWGATDDPADVDGSGSVEVGDLVVVITSWGPCVFAFDPPRENAEAEQIAFELLGADGPLLVVEEQYERIDRDLALIRAERPELVGQTHTPAWLQTHLIVQVQQDVPRDEYDCLNVYYQAVDEDVLFSSGGFDWILVTHGGNVNEPALAQVYMAAPEVGIAEPDGLFGGQNFWIPTPQGEGVWRWDIDDGWHDCFDGCDCHRVYVIETDADGNVEVISVEEFGAPWCEF